MGGVASLEGGRHAALDKLDITHAAMDEVFLILSERGLRHYRLWDAVRPIRPSLCAVNEAACV